MIEYKGFKHQLVEVDKTINTVRKELGISSSEMAKIAKGEYITIHTLEKLCEYFNCTPDKLIKFVPDEDAKSS